MTPFVSYSYLWPPRPEKRAAFGQLGFYANRGWVGQYKKNGTCTVLYVTPAKELLAKTRHNDNHKMWSPTERSTGPIRDACTGDGWYVFECEVLHNKTSTVKDTVYVFDILVSDGQKLEGTTFMERQLLLKKLFGITNSTPHTKSHYIVAPNVWLAKLIPSDKFKDTMIAVQEAADGVDGLPEDEGLVLKNPNAKLKNLSGASSNKGWQIKCRVATKNYSF